jgi:ligand-binding sensor domain-containing protein/two-component sensor histidine kinase
MIHSQLYATLLLVAVASAQLTSQQGGSRQVFHFGEVSSAQGLSNRSITAVVQDKRGFLWIGTEDGLFRFDGYGTKVYRHNPTDSMSLCHNSIKALLLDHEGSLWVGTHHGLSRMNMATGRFRHFFHQQADSGTLIRDDVNTLCEDKSGSVWIGTENGLYLLPRAVINRAEKRPPKGQDWAFVNSSDVLSVSKDDSVFRVKSIVEDASGALWIGTFGGLYHWDRQTNHVSRFRHDPTDQQTLSSNVVVCVYADRTSNLWVGTMGGGLCMFERTTRRFVRYSHEAQRPETISNDNVNAIYRDNAGILWVGTRIGLNVLNEQSGRFTRYMSVQSDIYSIGENQIRTLYEDNGGTLWIGTLEGLFSLSPRSRHLKHFLREPQDPVRQLASGILEDSEETLWLWGISGLTRVTRQGGSRTFLHQPGNPHSLSHDRVVRVEEDKKGNLWVATFGGGLNRLDRRTETFHRYPLMFDGDIIGEKLTALCVDSLDNLWIGTWEDALLYLNVLTGQVRRFMKDTVDGQIPMKGRIRQLFEDSHGNLWIGTSLGLIRFKVSTNHVTVFRSDARDSRSLDHDVINALYEDVHGNLWIGTTAGLNRFDAHTESFTRYVQNPDVEWNSVAAIRGDARGRLWVSFYREGLSLFDPDTERFLDFSYSDGLQSLRFQEGSYERRNGELMFCGVKGFNLFHPDSIWPNKTLPSVVVTGFRKSNQPIEVDSIMFHRAPIRISYDEQPFSFEFAALDFTNPDRNQYAWRLDGFFEGAWVYGRHQRSVTFTNLLPGEYVIRVKASNSDGIWNEEGASLRVTITPLYWQTWWFGMAVSLVVAAGIWWVYRFRVRRLVEMERLRLRIANDLHDELASNLTSIAMFGKILQDDEAAPTAPQGHRGQLLERITDLSHQSVASIRDIIWALDRKVETLESLLLRVEDWAQSACRARGIEFRMEVPPEGRLPKHDLHAERRQHLWLFLKEAINNALKHSKCNRVTISVHYLRGLLHVHIEDDGVGFIPIDREAGKGLTTMRTRAKELGGEFEIKSEAGRGTTVTLVLKWTGTSKRVYSGRGWRLRYLDVVSKYFGI